MSIGEHVRIARRFQRSVRIDTDFSDPASLDGFICPASSALVLEAMAKHVKDSGHTAFTWTGPYGSGKSALGVALCGLMSNSAPLRRKATEALGRKTVSLIQDSFPGKGKGWKIVPAIGRRERPAQVIGEALEANGVVGKKRKQWTDQAVLNALITALDSSATSRSGLVLIVDEMGKCLEQAALDGTDIYLFQEIAELAVRSNKRLLVVGVLHQSFEEYANRASRTARDEWAKVQGRFIDLPVNTAGEEQLELLSKAIEADKQRNSLKSIAKTVGSVVRSNRAGAGQDISNLLENCWPLHPVVSCLLGPISRRRFGQNQRSLFGFLNSAEPKGFQDFLRSAEISDLYTPDLLWDYLTLNLEPSILASPDGHRWAIAAEVIERCEAQIGNGTELALLKTIALIDLFKERSGLVPSLTVLESAFSKVARDVVKGALQKLSDGSFVTYRKFIDGYAVFAGSDFNIEAALVDALKDVSDLDFAALQDLAGLQPILAKRHYHSTGTLRWFDVQIAPLTEVVALAQTYEAKHGAIGKFLLAVPTKNETEDEAALICREAAKQSDAWDIVVGLSKRAWSINELAIELLGLQRVREERPELAGDAVARREVAARMVAAQNQLELELHRAFETAEWFIKHRTERRYTQAQLNGIASDLADKRFSEAPLIHNELLNRTRPSSNAIAAQNALIRRMIENEGQERLAIEGYPSEGGLFASILDSTRLYRVRQGKRAFFKPEPSKDPANVIPCWKAASEFLQENSKRVVSAKEIYGLWGNPPFGIKAGLMPVLFIAFLLANRERLAFYREGLFQPKFQSIDADYLLRDSADFQVRWMNLGGVSRRLLSSMADVVREVDDQNLLRELEPIDVGRGLISIYLELPAWTKRTANLSKTALHVRETFKRANDPHSFLFEQLPASAQLEGDSINEEQIAELVMKVKEALLEMRTAYPTMLIRLRDLVLRELQVPNTSEQMLRELRERAKNVVQLAGDFRIEAFVTRLSTFTGSEADVEGLASLAINKPPRDWSDPDVDRAAIELAQMAQQFVRIEAFTRVKGRPERRHSMAVVVGVKGVPTPLLEEFDIAEHEVAEVNALAQTVAEALERSDGRRKNVILAVLAELSARYMGSNEMVTADEA